MSDVRTRFAPSPTGYLHLGSARTALFNWAFARRKGGTFVLRIEDTDRERSTEESERAILDGLRWLGLDWDEGPLRQSERSERHREVVESLLESGRAYRCVCTREELDTRKVEGGNRVYDGRCRDRGLGADCGPHTVRLRIADDEPLEWNDLVFGESGQLGEQIGDAIIRRSDGTPLYNLAVVVDDLDMGITHVIRGTDHHSNTPLQIALYRALDAPLPQFAHVPLIVGKAGKKLSKRRDPVAIQHFRDEGYLQEAMANWLIRLGWSHGDDEVFSLDQIQALFDLDAVGRAGAQADLAKLDWLNQHYMKELSPDDLFARLLPALEKEAEGPVSRSDGLDLLISLLRERSNTLSDMAGRARWMLRDDIELDDKAAGKHLKAAAGPLLTRLNGALSELTRWNAGEIEAAFERVRHDAGDIGMGKLAQPVRVAVTGTAASPGIFETLEALGQARTVKRIADAARLCPPAE